MPWVSLPGQVLPSLSTSRFLLVLSSIGALWAPDVTPGISPVLTYPLIMHSIHRPNTRRLSALAFCKLRRLNDEFWKILCLLMTSFHLLIMLKYTFRIAAN